MMATLSPPQMLMPETEATALRAAYARAGAILEYGAGGSTLMAAGMPGKSVTAVESDKGWARRMRAWFDAHPPADGSHVDILWSDIGPTGDWGRPADESGWQRYARYPLEVWSRPGIAPDVVLVDGRFRVGCALATLYRTRKPVELYFDDYVTRSYYHKVEEYLGQPRILGRMALFHLRPTPIPPEHLLRIVTLMQRP